MKHLSETANLEETTRAIRAVERMVGAKTLEQSMLRLQGTLRSNQLLAEHMSMTAGLAVGLFHISRELSETGTLQNVDPTNHITYEAICFAIGIYRVANSVNQDQARKLWARVVGGLKNYSDLRALHFEISTASHLSRQGFDIEFLESASHPGPEFYAQKRHARFQVECKMISCDKGRSIHREHALGIFECIRRKFAHTAARGPDLFVDINLTSKAKGSPEENRNIAIAALSAALKRTAVETAEIRVSVSEIGPQGLIHTARLKGTTEIRDLVLNFVQDNSERFLFTQEDGQGIIFRIRSSQPDRVLEEIFGTLRKSSKNQFHSDHPAVMWVKLEDMTGAQLEAIGREEGSPTGLQIESSKFLNSKSTSKVAALIFSADGEVKMEAGNLATRPGRTYYFTKPEATLGAERELNEMLG